MLEIYEKSVAELKHDMINLGMKVEQAVDNAWKALENKDIELAQRLYDGDDVIDDLVKNCMKKDLTIQVYDAGPIAADYRSLMATLKILSDLERITTIIYADISHYVIHLEQIHHNVPLPQGIKEMYGVMASMVQRCHRFLPERGTSSQASLMRDKDDITIDQAFNATSWKP